MANLKLSQLNIYPIKSLGGIGLETSTVTRRGLKHDRRRMLVDEQGEFVSQRSFPVMATLGTEINAEGIEVFLKTQKDNRISIPFDVEFAESDRVKVWSAVCKSMIYPKYINEWFSEILGQKVRLVYMPGSTHRAADGRYAPKGQYVSFADGFPFLIIGQRSLEDLNNRMDQPLPMNRFRPNMVFTGGEPFVEDSWSDFRVGDVKFRAVKPCARCQVTTTDQDTGARGKEPLTTLAEFRAKNNRILFGQNVIWLGKEEEEIRVGDTIRLMAAS